MIRTDREEPRHVVIVKEGHQLIRPVVDGVLPQQVLHGAEPTLGIGEGLADRIAEAEVENRHPGVIRVLHRARLLGVAEAVFAEDEGAGLVRLDVRDEFLPEPHRHVLHGVDAKGIESGIQPAADR